MKKTLLFCDLKRIFFNEPCRDYGHALIQIAPAKVMTCGEHGPMGRSIVSNVLSVIAVARYLKLPFVMNAMSLTPYVRLVVTPKFPSVGRRKDNLWLVIQKNEKQTYWLNCYRPTT